MVVVAILLTAVLSACQTERSPTTPTVVTTTTPSGNTPPATDVPPVVGGVLSIAMPIDPADAASTAFGLLPFGYHGPDHAGDGHAGWDIECRQGALVRAAAAGEILAIESDTVVAGRTKITIEHRIGAHIYHTVYANLSSTTEGIVRQAAVRQGQVIGLAGAITATIGNAPVTYAMTHFQVDDFETHREGPDPKAVSPLPFLNAEGRASVDRLWVLAAYAPELTEPFIAMSRDQQFPLTRTWTLESGDGPAGLSFTRRTRVGTDHDYLVLTQSGTAIESGGVMLRLPGGAIPPGLSGSRPFPTIDLVTPTGPRLGIYDIVGDRMRLAVGSPGAPRPTDLGAASVYRTPSTTP